MKADTTRLDMPLQVKFTMLSKACFSLNMSIVCVQALRTFAEQDVLFTHGRTAPGPIVTNAKGGRSWHNYGMAFDVAFIGDQGEPSWEEGKPWPLLGLMGEQIGLVWGGRFTRPDRGHFEYHPGLTLDAAYAKYLAGELCVKP